MRDYVDYQGPGFEGLATSDKQHLRLGSNVCRWPISKGMVINLLSYGGFLNHRGTPIHHPFEFRIFHEIDQSFLDTPIYGTPHIPSLDFLCFFQPMVFGLPCFHHKPTSYWGSLMETHPKPNWAPRSSTACTNWTWSSCILILRASVHPTEQVLNS